MIFLIPTIYHLAGMTFEISCKGRGIFSMGNIMPESRTVGIISTIPENSMASTWVRAIVETNNPNSRDTTMKIHGAISYGHIGQDLITLASMLRIPVCMHNVEEDEMFRPAAWNAFGMDKEGADYRACATYGPIYK